MSRQLISIHTPARGVTFIQTYVLPVIQISIHTPARGVTKQAAEAKMIYENFNPHSRTGSDASGRDAGVGVKKISIHTPARGVTIGEGDFQVTYYISIHTPARGVTVAKLGKELTRNISIHTPARGVTKGVRGPAPRERD